MFHVKHGGRLLSIRGGRSAFVVHPGFQGNILNAYTKCRMRSAAPKRGIRSAVTQTFRPNTGPRTSNRRGVGHGFNVSGGWTDCPEGNLTVVISLREMIRVCPNGAKHVSPGQSEAPPWVMRTTNHRSPARATQGFAGGYRLHWFALSGLCNWYQPRPRAALRSALGWYVKPFQGNRLLLALSRHR